VGAQCVALGDTDQIFVEDVSRVGAPDRKRQRQSG